MHALRCNNSESSLVFERITSTAARLYFLNVRGSLLVCRQQYTSKFKIAKGADSDY